MNPSDPQADALARWLEAHPGADPPDGLDPDVVEAVYMLRPDLAPAPRVSADDILASFGALPVGGATAEDAVTAEPAPVAASSMPSSVAEAPATPRAANTRLWAALGSVAALAAAVLVVAQVALNSTAPNSVSQLEAAVQSPSAAAPQGVRVAEEELPRPSDDAAAPRSAARERADAGGQAFGLLGGEDQPLDAVADLGSVEVADQNQWAEGEASGRSSALGELAGGAESGGGGADASGVGGLGNGTVSRGGPAIAASAPSPSPAPASRPAPAAASTGDDAFDGVFDEVFDAVADVDAEPEAEEDAFEDYDELAEFEVNDADGLLSADLDDSITLQDALPDEAPAVVQTAMPEATPQEERTVVETVSTSRSGNRRPRFGQRQQASAEQPSAPMDMPVAPPPVDPVDQARAQAAQLAGAQQYSQAFERLAPFVSPSAPTGLIVEAAEYAFAAGRWRDVVAVTTPRLNTPQPGDSAQQRARLFDLQARAQAMDIPDAGQPSMRMESMDSESPE